MLPVHDINELAAVGLENTEETMEMVFESKFPAIFIGLVDVPSNVDEVTVISMFVNVPAMEMERYVQLDTSLNVTLFPEIVKTVPGN